MIGWSHAARWLTMLVIAGLLAMHGAAGEHGLAGTGMPTMPMTAAMPTAPHSVEVHAAQQAAVAASMMSHTGPMCVALPVLLLLLTALAATLVRRRQRLLASQSGRWARTARAPPCPPPQVRGVCLT